MQLHQLLRFVKSGCRILIFNIAGVQLVSVSTKESLNVDLYEYNVVEIGVGWKDLKTKESAIYITLEK